MTASDKTLADIAARYGVAVSPDIVVRRIAPGVSSRPLPIWDAAKNQLVVPGWKEQREAERLASIKRSKLARSRAKTTDAAALASQMLAAFNAR